MATDFSSLDKLMEFGLGIGIATQMMNTMNHTIAKTAYPGVGINPGVSNLRTSSPANQPPVAPPAQREFYIVENEHVAGPFNESELIRLIEKSLVRNDTFCWSPGMNGWNLAEDIPEVNKLILLYS